MTIAFHLLNNQFCPQHLPALQLTGAQLARAGAHAGRLVRDALPHPQVVKTPSLKPLRMWCRCHQVPKCRAFVMLGHLPRFVGVKPISI